MARHAQERPDTRSREAVMLQGVRIVGRVRGLLFEATLEQRFQNPTNCSVELVYTFPLPYGAVLLGLDVLLGTQRLTGTVVGKRRAEADYEAALMEGHSAILLERNADGSHALNIGNLAAGETCVITLRYARPLRFEQGGIRLIVPTVIAPRYGHPLVGTGLRPHQVPETDMTVEYPFELAIEVRGELARCRVASPSHSIAVAPCGDGSGDAVRVSLAATAVLDRDFVLRLDQLPVSSLAVVSEDGVHPGQYAALISLCPSIEAAEAPPIAVKLLVDCSGSMGGDSIAAARKALLAIVDQLGERDRFSLSRFGSSVEHRSRGLWRVNPATRLTARSWIGELNADLGGTELESALVSTFALGHGEASDLLLVTDGEVFAIDSVLDTARQSGQRVFVVGIGSSPAEANLRRLAETSGGACDFVAPGEAVVPAILRMFARLGSPRLYRLALEWPDGAQPLWHSPLPKTLFDGDTVNLFAVFSETSAGIIRLMGGRNSEAPLDELASASLDEPLAPTDAVPRLAAAQRLAGLDETPAGAMAVDYQLVSAYTHFLLIHERAEEEKARELPELHKVNQMLPAGWGGFGSVGPAPVPSSWVYSLTDESLLGDMMDPAALPAVPRRPPMDLEYLGIPAFLRRAPADHDRPRALTGRVSESEAAVGLFTRHPRHDKAGFLTPTGFRDTLAAKPGDQWPRTYRSLREMGLQPELVEWLESIFAGEYSDLQPERAVVASFLVAFLSEASRKAIPAARWPNKQKADAAGEWLATRGVPASDPRLVADLEAYLENLAPGAWPSAMAAVAEPQKG